MLAGVKSVALFDKSPIVLSDLSSQFFFETSNIGQISDAVSAEKLAALNSYVPIKAIPELKPEYIKNYQVVVLANASREMELKVNEWTRQYGACFLCGSTRGLFAYAFNDFGTQFPVIDTTGEECIAGIVASITSVSVHLT